MSNPKESKEVAEKKNTAMAEAPSYAGYENMAGAGFENQTSDDYTIPFLHILQALSPQLEENDELKQGTIINTVTGEVFPGKEGIVFVPATTQHVYVEWKPRDAGGGFVGTHEVGSELVLNCLENQEFGEYITPEGNELMETFYVYGIAIDPEENAMQAVLAFNSSKIKKYKGWMTKAKTIQIKLSDGRRIPAPLFAHRYRLKTVNEKNSKGSFYNWDVSFDGANATESRLPPDSQIVESAVAIRDLLDSGKVRAAYESQSTEGAPDDSEPAF